MKEADLNVLVTGSTGFIGSHLVDELHKSGLHARRLVRESSRDTPGENIVVGDISQPSTLPDAVRGIDIIFHLAGSTTAQDREEYERVNTQGTLNLLRAAADYAPGLRRFVLASSLAAVGPSRTLQEPATEETLPNPVSPYGESKLHAEEATHQSGLPYTIARPPAVFGPRDRKLFVYYRLVNHGFILQPSGKEHYLSMIYIADLVSGLVAAATAEVSNNQTYFLANPEPITWRRLGHMIAHSTGAHPRLITIPASLVLIGLYMSEMIARIRSRQSVLPVNRARELRELYWICDPSKAQRELGFSPRVTLADGIRITANWYREHGWLR